MSRPITSAHESVWGSDLLKTRADFSGTDDELGGSLVGRHLLSLGHRRLGHISGEPWQLLATARKDEEVPKRIGRVLPPLPSPVNFEPTARSEWVLMAAPANLVPDPTHVYARTSDPVAFSAPNIGLFEFVSNPLAVAANAGRLTVSVTHSWLESQTSKSRLVLFDIRKRGQAILGHWQEAGVALLASPPGSGRVLAMTDFEIAFRAPKSLLVMDGISTGDVGYVAHWTLAGPQPKPDTSGPDTAKLDTWSIVHAEMPTRDVAVIQTEERLIGFHLDRQSTIFEFPLTGESVFAMSPGGRYLALSQQGRVRMLDPRTGHQLGSFNQDTTHSAHVAFSPDGKRLAVVEESWIKVYQLQSGRLIHRFYNLGNGRPKYYRPSIA